MNNTKDTPTARTETLRPLLPAEQTLIDAVRFVDKETAPGVCYALTQLLCFYIEKGETDFTGANNAAMMRVYIALNNAVSAQA